MQRGTETTVELNFTNSKYFNTVYLQLVIVFAQCTRYFFNAARQVKTIIIIGISEANPVAEIVSVFLSLSLYTYWDLRYLLQTKFLKERCTHTQCPFNFHCSIAYGNNTNVTFQFKIDHDNGTVKHILSHLVAKQEQYNYHNLIYRHVDRHCLHYQVCI